MAIPESEIKAWLTIFGDELVNTAPPFYGINLYDVPVENWEKFKANLREQYEYVKMISGRSHLWAVRDHGSFKRVIWINYYPEGAKPIQPGLEDDEVREGLRKQKIEDEGPACVAEGHRLITRYQWFTATEVDGDPDALF